MYYNINLTLFIRNRLPNFNYFIVNSKLLLKLLYLSNTNIFVMKITAFLDICVQLLLSLVCAYAINPVLQVEFIIKYSKQKLFRYSYTYLYTCMHTKSKRKVEYLKNSVTVWTAQFIKYCPTRRHANASAQALSSEQPTHAAHAEITQFFF